MLELRLDLLGELDLDPAAAFLALAFFADVRPSLTDVGRSLTTAESALKTGGGTENSLAGEEILGLDTRAAKISVEVISFSSGIPGKMLFVSRETRI